ncbi:MAG: hypothetical protein LBE48_06265 [Methanomassiliicoccaceae archaeon]|jgi:hypothetical protein|nr:hypothetical protein [Methanomassiliicoccaceae archaeon]
MESNMIFAAIIGFGAALGLIYIVLRKYTYPAVEQPFFSDPAFFKLFTLGLIAGTAVFVGYTFFQKSWASIVIAVLFALVFELVKLVILNLKRFHGKSDTVFYGFGLGVGVGCAFAFGFVFYASSWAIELLGTEGTDITMWILFGFIAIQTVILHSATGMTIGEGIARRRPFEFLFQALIIGVAYQLLISQIWAGHSEMMMYAFLVLSFLVAFGYFYHIVYRKLPNVIRDVLREEGKSRKDIPR